MKNLLKCKKAEAYPYILLILMPIWIFMFLNASNDETKTELIYTGTIQDYFISYGNGKNNDLTRIYFQDNSTLTFNQQMPYLQQNHTYTIKYYQETMIVIQIQSTEDFR